MINATAINEREATKYLKNPRENGVKNLSANLVKTKPDDQKMIVIIAKG